MGPLPKSSEKFHGGTKSALNRPCVVGPRGSGFSFDGSRGPHKGMNLNELLP
jgi:hypothetical protein